MTTPPRVDLAELTITAALLSIYAGALGTARVLGVMQLVVR